MKKKIYRVLGLLLVVIVLYYGGIHLFKYQIIELYLSMEHKEYVEEEGAFIPFVITQKIEIK